MGYHHHRRRSSIHVMAEAALNFRFGLSARRSSYFDRSSDRNSCSHHRKINDSPKASTQPCYIRVVVPEEPPHFAAARHKAEGLAHPHAHHRIVVPEHTHSRDHRKPAHLHAHRIIVPEASDSWDTTFHAFCVATDVTYARLSERLDRLRDHKAAINLRLRAHGGSKASWESLELVQNDIRKVKLTLKEIRQKIEERRGEWNGKGEVFMFGGRWAAFL